MTTFPDFETYRDLVMEGTKQRLRVFDPKEVDEYLHGEEAQEEIRTRYNDDLEDFNEGRLAKVDLRDGCIPSVAHCLSLMF